MVRVASHRVVFIAAGELEARDLRSTVLRTGPPASGRFCKSPGPDLVRTWSQDLESLRLGVHSLQMAAPCGDTTRAERRTHTPLAHATSQ